MSLCDEPAQPGAIADAIVEQASNWLARLWSGEASDDELARCAAWRAAHPDHERAWRRLGGIEAKLLSVPAVARAALQPGGERRSAPRRRRVLRALGLAVTAGGAFQAMRGTRAWQVAAADQATGVGEIKAVTLADGTRFWLDTASAVDVRFDARERRVVLLRGAVCITTAHDAAGRPFRIETRQGVVRALGTRFVVRDDGDATRVDVFEGAVEIRTAAAPMRAMRLAAGQSSSFSVTAVGAPLPADEQAAAWTRRLLIAEHMPVDAFVAALARYRPGIVRCDPALAAARVSGVFSLVDTDRALASLQAALPVAVVYRTRYWVSIVPR
ncbi:FecR domain-containing protein [Burkholderia sp. FERM BP-3421]|uniref:FecR domain-containing protein n=1 Tax=Burkholderia sp. FERM BP-3421 TaxID=1494466 RepID=UPI00235E3F83|nr:FecR domain-containing protein [Burkholderia sp. FERM BP-3421]WDD94592.1 FecR domain-containing protein [Burkholderia sp. FERM BP-3421]